MKKSLISLVLLFAAVGSHTTAQTFTGAIDRNNAIPVEKGSLIGFNAGTGTLEKPFNKCDGCSGAVNPLYQQQIESTIGNRIMYRAPAGEAGMYYNFWYSGWGNFNNFKGHSEGWNMNAAQRNAIYGGYANYNDLTVTTAYQTKTPGANLLLNVINPPNHKNNLLFPYINIITNHLAETANANFVINMVEHYRDFRSNKNSQAPLVLNVNGSASGVGGVISPSNYYPRNDVFQNTAVIAGITTMDQLNSSSLSANTKDIVKQNIDAFVTLIKNKVRVVHVELGNELTNEGRFITNSSICTNPITPLYSDFLSQEIPGVSNDHVIWYRNYGNTPCGNDNTNTNNSISAYGNLCKMYIALIKDAVNKLYIQTGNPFYLDIKNNIKFAVPYVSIVGVSDGHRKWGEYLDSHKSDIGFQAFVMHPYSPEPVLHLPLLTVHWRLNLIL